MRKLIMLFVLLAVFCGCSGKSRNYTVIHKPTGKKYYINGAPLHHEDGPIMGLPGQWPKEYYFFNYGPENYLVKLRKDETKIIGPDGEVEDIGTYLP